MNEAEILMYMLSRQKDITAYGANEQELLQSLQLTDKNSKSNLNNLLAELSKNVGHLGLRLKYNSINGHWFLTFRDNIAYMTGQTETHVLSVKLAATLFSILMLSLTANGAISISELQEIRKKKNLMDDIEELVDLGYIKKNDSQVQLTAKVFYHIDLDEIMKEIKRISNDV